MDVELVRSGLDHIGIAARFFADAEVDQLAAASPEQRARRFFSLWTCKEAVAKATGTGLRMPLDSFSVHLDDLSLNWPSAGRMAESWSLFQRHEGRHVMSLAVRVRGAAAVQVDWCERPFAAVREAIGRADQSLSRPSWRFGSDGQE